jgi:hypothetical protein
VVEHVSGSDHAFHWLPILAQALDQTEMRSKMPCAGALLQSCCIRSKHVPVAGRGGGDFLSGCRGQLLVVEFSWTDLRQTTKARSLAQYMTQLSLI